ncbi:hypothetical protein [Bacillus sp. S/N-304-OC-R1]|uniref:hypothetical protein n=1 Tax=Bacillus sp. S/N-304-OC-R1 TaxID=2758034 RepID=UPI001C8D0C04|nr:hypothetical protein [Bacillus sp. S/N-304-OC-R1]MBY0123806.1 hypothetical protein [Bacillus sp. S/N-304-OC-R1]
MRKHGGIIIITFSLILALSCAIYYQEDIIIANLMFWMISLPLFISGLIIRTSKYEFKHRGKRWVSIYIFFFFILPLLIYLQANYDDFKRHTFVDEHFIVYEPASGILGDLSLGVFIILIALFACRFLNPELKRNRLLNIMIIGTIILLIGFNYLMFSDYRGIHEEKGLVSSNWKGEKHIIPYEEIDSVYVEPYVHYAGLSNTTDETRFVWKVTFQPSNQKNKVVYHFPMMLESNLEQTIEIKRIAMENDIPFIIEKMSQKTLKWFDFDLELEGLDKERYYELFQVNNK